MQTSTQRRPTQTTRERYYLTQSRQLVQFISMNADGTYNVIKNGAAKTIHPNFLTFVPAEKLQWFKSQVIHALGKQLNKAC